MTASEADIQQRWISVEDRLPEDCVDVLAYVQFYAETQKDIQVMWWDGTEEYGWYDTCDRFYRRKLVTHWMPLPDPPDTTVNLKLTYAGKGEAVIQSDEEWELIPPEVDDE